MPANLTPAYFEAEKRYRASETPEEKIEALNEMLRVMPKHKGTDHLRADIRTKIAKLTQSLDKKTTTQRASTHRSPAAPKPVAGSPTTSTNCTV